MTTASTACPAGKVVTAAVMTDANTPGQTTGMANSGGQFNWHLVGQSNASGYAGLYWTVCDGAAHTFTVSGAQDLPLALDIQIWNGVNATNPFPVASVKSGRSLLSPTNPSYKSTSKASLGIGVAMDWKNGSGASSTDSYSAHGTTHANDSLVVDKSTTTASTGTLVTLDFRQTSPPDFSYVIAEMVPSVSGAQGATTTTSTSSTIKPTTTSSTIKPTTTSSTSTTIKATTTSTSSTTVTNPPASGLSVNATQQVHAFDTKMKGMAFGNWNFEKAWGKPYIGEIQGLPQAVAAINPGLIRYAGGLWANYVGFDPNDAQQHTPQVDWSINGHTYGFSYGTDELKDLDRFAKSVGADVMIQVNLTQNDPGMWAGLAQYAKDNGLTSIKYYELANELDLVWSQGDHTVDPSTYASRVVAYQHAILAVDPTLHIVGGVAAPASDNFYNYDKNVVSSFITDAAGAAHNAGTNLDAVSYHWYQNSNHQDSAAYLEWGDWAANASDPNYAGNAYGRAWSGEAAPFIRSQALGSSASTKIGVSELGLDSSNGIYNNGNFVGALWYSDVLGRLAYSGVDWVTQYSSFADSSDYYAPIYTDTLSATPTLRLRPTYYALVMYNKYFGDEMVGATSDKPSDISIWASTDSKDPGKLKLRITNMTGSAISTPVALNNVNARSAVSYVLASNNPLDESDTSQTDAADVSINGHRLNAADVAASLNAIPGQAVNLSGNTIRMTFPAYSSTAIVVTTS